MRTAGGLKRRSRCFAMSPCPLAAQTPEKGLDLRSASRLQLEAKDKEQSRQFQLEVRKLEIEADKAVRLRQLELDSQLHASGAFSQAASMFPPPPHPPAFDVSKHISLVPTFRETEVDAYFGAFERIAVALRWPSEAWALLVQCKIHGKALLLEDSLDYDSVKVAILRVYELVPEAYRQKCRHHRKGPNQTHVEFAREKGMLFAKWIASCKAADYSALRELIMMEELKKCLPDRIVVYLNEQKVNSLSAAAVLADEYVLTHKSVFPSVFTEKSRRVSAAPFTQPSNVNNVKREERECFYCHKPGHVIANCMTLKRKEQPQNMSQPKGIGLIKAESSTIPASDTDDSEIDPCFRPFVFDGFIYLTGESADQRPVHILRDTGGSQSVIVASALPFSEQSACGYGSILRGIEMGYIPRSVHNVHVQSKLITLFFPVAVCPACLYEV